MGDATECIKSIGNALFAVFKAIFSNPNGLEMIMNYIFKKIDKNIKSKKVIKYMCYSKNSELKLLCYW